jgi:hypothetical protein
MPADLPIADDVFAAAEELAAREGRSAGEVVSDLARQSLTRLPPLKYRNGVPLLPIRGAGVVVTTEMVQQLLDETE